MRHSLFAFMLAGLLLGLLWAGTAAQSQQPVLEVTRPAAEILPPEVDISQAAGLALTATVGVAPGVCAITNTVEVRIGTLVYYCYTIAYTGTQPVTLHRLETARQGLITDTLTRTVQPGESINTVALGLVITDLTDSDAANSVTWTARTAPNAESPVTVSDVDSTLINVVTPTLTVFKTVGQDPADCPVAQSVRVPSGATAYYCLTLINRGDITLTTHTVIDSDPFLAVNGTFNRVLPPGESLVITSGIMSSLGLAGTLTRVNVTQPITSRVAVTSATQGGLTASGVATASVDVGTMTVLFAKTVSTDPHVCGQSSNISAPPGAQLYYCASIQNTGQETITRHELAEPALSIDLRFDYVLPPGARLVITNSVLTDQLDQPRVFGPFNFIPVYANVVNHTMQYTGTSQAGFRVFASSATSAFFVPTATPTFTPTPRPTSTPRPIPTAIPTETFTPLPPTETPTPTFTPITPSPTPTRDWSVSFVTTPTPDPFAVGVFVPDTPTPDFFVPESPLPPPDDPVSAQLTAIAFAETEIAATATALQIALSTPEPFVPDLLPTETPVPIEAELLPTPDLSLPQPPAEEPAPVEPPPTAPVIIEPAPDATLVEVTATPLPPAAGDDQRPIILPTPTPTADYLLLAARSVDGFTAAAGWIWFLGGSLVFFVTAGIVAGLFFYQREQHRFELLPDEDEEAWYDEEWPEDEWLPDAPADRPPSPPRPAAPRPRRGDDWPADLP